MGIVLFNFPPTSPTWTISPFRFVAAPTTLVQICQSSLLQTDATKIIPRFKISYKIQPCSSWCILSPWNFWLPSIFVVLCKAPAKEKQKKPTFHTPVSLFFGLSRHMVRSNSTSLLRCSGCTNEATQLSSCLSKGCRSWSQGKWGSRIGIVMISQNRYLKSTHIFEENYLFQINIFGIQFKIQVEPLFPLVSWNMIC